MDCPSGQKSGHCREVAVSEDSTLTTQKCREMDTIRNIHKFHLATNEKAFFSFHNWKLVGEK